MNVAPLAIRRVHPTDSARVHPVFINSDLRPEIGVICTVGNDYPIDRLNPVCAGYFNHVEYEAAMESIRQVEAMNDMNVGITGFTTLSETPKITLQHRRSTSTYPHNSC
jgi:hypothetical protein